jgi:hypothetical protein
MLTCPRIRTRVKQIQIGGRLVASEDMDRLLVQRLIQPTSLSDPVVKK